MDSITVRESRWNQLVPFLGCLAVIWVSIQNIPNLKNPPLHIEILILVFAGISIRYLRKLFRNSKLLEIDDFGIWFLDWRLKPIRWKDVQGAFIKSVKGKDYACFTVVDQNELRRRFGSTEQAVYDATRIPGFGDLYLNATDMGLMAYDVIDYARMQIAKNNAAKNTDQSLPTYHPPSNDLDW